MGKARILSAQGEGLYTIELLEDRTRAEANRAVAGDRVAYLDGRISDLELDLAAAQSEVDSAADTQDQTIAAYQAALIDDQIDTAEARADMVKAGEAVIQSAAKRDAIARHIGALKSERFALQRRIDLIDALPALRQISAWCADYTEDLSGNVATAEVPGEIGQVIIQPGYDGDEVTGWPAAIQGGAVWSAEKDGAIQPALSGTPASVFYNLAMMPGWQRWRPTFRIATISNIKADLCDITLDAATSSQQGLNVNAQPSYAGVPIYYMECNGGAFENGDKVLVAFSGSTEAPLVVGFADNPKECKPQIWIAFIHQSWAYGVFWAEPDEGVYSDFYAPSEPESGLDGSFPEWAEDNDNFETVLGDKAEMWAGRCLMAALTGDMNEVAPDATSLIPLHLTGKTDAANLTAQDFENAVRLVDPDAGSRDSILFLFNSFPNSPSASAEFDDIKTAVQLFVNEHGANYAGVTAKMVETSNLDWRNYGARWVRWLTPADPSLAVANYTPASEVPFTFSRDW